MVIRSPCNVSGRHMNDAIARLRGSSQASNNVQRSPITFRPRATAQYCLYDLFANGLAECHRASFQRAQLSCAFDLVSGLCWPVVKDDGRLPPSYSQTTDRPQD